MQNSKRKGGTARDIRWLTIWCILISFILGCLLWDLGLKKRTNYRFLWRNELPAIKKRIEDLERRKYHDHNQIGIIHLDR